MAPLSKSERDAAIAIVALLLLQILLILVLIWAPHFPQRTCEKPVSVCQQAYTTLQPVFIGKAVATLPRTLYKEVDCSQPHDRIVQKCPDESP